MSSQTGAAGRCADRRSGLNKGFNITPAQSFQVNLLGAWEHNQAYFRVHLPALEQGGGDLQILQPAIGTGAYHHLIQDYVTGCADRAGIFRKMGKSHYRFHFRYIIFPNLKITGIGIRLVNLVRTPRSLFHIFAGYIISSKDPVLAPRFNSHIGHGKTIIHRQPADNFPGKFHRHITGAVNPDIPYGMKY